MTHLMRRADRADRCWPSHAARTPLARPLRVATGGAPPSPALLERLDELGIDVTHLYGLTETFGPVVICDWQPEWDDARRPERRRGSRRARASAT